MYQKLFRLFKVTIKPRVQKASIKASPLSQKNILFSTKPNVNDSKIQERMNKVLHSKNIHDSLIDLDTQMIDLGLDRRDLLEMIQAVNQEFGTKITEDEAYELNTLEDLKEYITKNYTL